MRISDWSSDVCSSDLGTSLFFVNVTQKYDLTKQSVAPFAQGTYDLGALFDALSGLSLTAGLRYTWDDTDGTASIRQVAAGLIPLVDAAHASETKTSALTYTAGLDYKFDTTLLYGKISRGYKTGGISVVVVNPDHYTYKPEFVTNYEVGEKTDFEIAGMPVRLNSAVYYTDYKDLQKSGTDRSEEHTSELQSLMRISYAVFCMKKQNHKKNTDKKT